MTLDGHIQDGHIILDTPVVLPEGTRVTVAIQPDRRPPLDTPEVNRPSDEQAVTDAGDSSAPALATSDWLTEFDAWVKSHSSRNPNVDDSRDGMYPDRD
jgi:hypothetical protein